MWLPRLLSSMILFDARKGGNFEFAFEGAANREAVIVCGVAARSQPMTVIRKELRDIVIVRLSRSLRRP